MIIYVLRVVRSIFLGLTGLFAVLVMFTALQFNLRGAGIMACLVLAFYVASRAIGRAVTAVGEGGKVT